jgi:4-hydroxybenzoate polyprenyltransferase
MVSVNPQTAEANPKRFGGAGNSSRPATVIAVLRVPEWVKNAFVIAPLIFSGQLLKATALWNTILACAALCMASSGVYIFNDLVDMAKDREHPLKRMRPLASGAISPTVAGVMSGCLVLLAYAVFLPARPPRGVWVLLTAFLLLNAAYSLYLKQQVIIDVLTIAVGYVLRVLIGGAAIGVQVTHWLLLCTFLLATFLGFSKRRHELTLLGPEATRHRPVLHFYSEDFLDRVSLLTLAMTLTCYILYTISPETIARFGTAALVYSSLIVMFGLFRYLFLIHVKKMGSPVELFYYDRQIVLSVIVWTLYVIGVVYVWPAIARLVP